MNRTGCSVVMLLTLGGFTSAWAGDSSEQGVATSIASFGVREAPPAVAVRNLFGKEERLVDPPRESVTPPAVVATPRVPARQSERRVSPPKVLGVVFRADVGRVVVLQDGDVRLVPQGGVIAGRFRVERVFPSSVRLYDQVNGETQVVLTQE